ncbi:hypothetical protein QJS10_CPB14g01134 [Acorus calamus]|uniref:Reverse transcriptase domain-containing protein n=1 Tax=Acorus calamus TaxID=4465 RepID=A0AAV9DAE0_ACOCL|nr:hypothetical protein QJS10_CPB14g01134 [Acorus calamus]
MARVRSTGSAKRMAIKLRCLKGKLRGWGREIKAAWMATKETLSSSIQHLDIKEKLGGGLTEAGCTGRRMGQWRLGGLWQEDPLSPILFTIVVNVLGRMLWVAVLDGWIKGLGGWGALSTISQVQFIDDMLLLCKVKEESIQGCRFVLKYFK